MFVGYLGYFYLIYQRLTTTMQYQVASKVKFQATNQWRTYKIVRYWKEQYIFKDKISSKFILNLQHKADYYKYWVWILKT